MSMFCGVDEAGKGAVLGPMVVAAVATDHEDLLPGIGIKDSKQLSPEKRTLFYEEIAGTCSVALRVVSAAEIDSGRKSMTMNVMLARLHAAVITDLVPDFAYVDACDVIAETVRSHGNEFPGLSMPCQGGTPCRRIIPARIGRKYRCKSDTGQGN